MDIDYEFKYHRLEERNWWFVSRREIIFQLIRENSFRHNASILEIGCSGGPLIESLNQRRFFNVAGIDISQSAVNLCRKKGIRNIQIMDGEKTEFRKNKFDLVIASDILEHISNDDNALSEWHRILKSGGKLIIFVPSFNFLWSGHDIANCHYRRYSKAELKNKIKKAGFKINRISYWNFILFFPVCIWRILQRFYFGGRNKKDQLYRMNSLLNKIFENLLKVENWLLKFINFPIGVSLFTICEKK
jgi:2-polyprenyl-3-methyl-5-hydroxy-6-metoxy-1,4-benzoquinol methylase